MSPWREYADPEAADAAGDRREEGRALRRTVPFDVALALPELSAWDQPDAFAAAVAAEARTGMVTACIGNAPAGVVREPGLPGRMLDVLDVDDALPGPWEYDVLMLAAGLAGESRPRRRREIARRAGEAYRDAVRALARHPLHARRAEALGRAAALGAKRDGSVGSAEAVGVFVRDDRIRRSRADARWARATGAEVSSAEDPERELSLYRESLSERDAMLLASYRVADAYADARGHAMVLLARGGTPRDQLLLEAVPAGPSTLEPAFGVWRLGSDVHRVLSMRSTVPLVPPELSGWSTSVDGSLGRVWQRARAGQAVRSDGDPGRQAGRLGRSDGDPIRRAALLGLVHACTGDAAMLAGYLGSSAAFPDAVAEAAQRASS